MNELSKSIVRRLSNPNFSTKYFIGDGIDVGGGDDSLAQYSYLFPRVNSIINYDRPEGDAQTLTEIEDNRFDFVHSSHCLEHLVDPLLGILNWLRILKVGGYLIVTVPDEDLYEQGVFPSTFSDEHKWTFTIYKKKSWSTKTHNIIDILTDPELIIGISIEKIELLDATFDYSKSRQDQTLTSLVTESCIEFIVQKVG